MVSQGVLLLLFIDYPMIELSKGHYGDAKVGQDDQWKSLCVNYDPLCANYTVGNGVVPDSRLADSFCWKLGYGAGYAIPLDADVDDPVPGNVFSRRCDTTG